MDTNTEKGSVEAMTTVPDLDSSTTKPDSERDVEAGSDNRILSANEKDPNIVDWDGPNDLENPMNWPDSKKWINISIVSIITIVT